MVKARWSVSILCLFFLCVSLAKAAEKDLKIVTSTGRAAIISDEQMQETRSRALEDALYNAALLGGAEIDGFSSVQAGTQLDDHFVVRPSSKIVDYDVVNEEFDDLHYAITIEAAVGDVGKTDCQNRPVNNVTMFAPAIKIDDKVPAWLSQIPTGLVKDIYEQMARKPDVKMVYKATVQLDPVNLTRDSRFSYRALTAGVAKIRDGDFALSTRIMMNKVVQKEGFQENHFVDAVFETIVFIDSDFKETQTVTHQVRIPIRTVSAIKFIGNMTSPNRSKIRGEFVNLVLKHVDEVTDVMQCTPLAAIMVVKQDGLHIPIGARQGLRDNRLAVVSDKTLPWTILKVVKTNRDSALLKPLNRKRSLLQLNGQKISFLEFN
jgi:hypothetical protein